MPIQLKDYAFRYIYLIGAGSVGFGSVDGTCSKLEQAVFFQNGYFEKQLKEYVKKLKAVKRENPLPNSSDYTRQGLYSFNVSVENIFAIRDITDEVNELLYPKRRD